jgi:hypothetical protein
VPYRPAPMHAEVKALYLQNACRDLHNRLGEGGEDGMRLIERCWPDLARALESWDRIFTVPLIEEEPFPAAQE